MLTTVSGLVLRALRGVHTGLWRCASLPRFNALGRRCRIEPGDFRFEHIRLGDDVYIGPGARFWAVHSTICIGDKCVFGPDVMIMAGDHDFRQLGRFMHDVTDADKDQSFDRDVVVEEDVWVGARAIILKGARIGRGAVIGAGAVVTKDIPAYAVAAGVPARVCGFRWTLAETIEHERLLYPEDRRIPEASLCVARAGTGQ